MQNIEELAKSLAEIDGGTVSIIPIKKPYAFACSNCGHQKELEVSEKYSLNSYMLHCENCSHENGGKGVYVAAMKETLRIFTCKNQESHA